MTSFRHSFYSGERLHYSADSNRSLGRRFTGFRLSRQGRRPYYDTGRTGLRAGHKVPGELLQMGRILNESGGSKGYRG